ncbi:MAG: IS701 family transposase [Thermoplasmata archaeon YP2-bin.285]|uniref:IS701 family transposase n=1 Tax=Candidatus Sysuiplasma superficiale TaxID=2823368 RepID=A0A8J8CFK7_9ARCH|nr:IS701 family transposase [Candidatus Sysuiplasma superficiale]
METVLIHRHAEAQYFMKEYRNIFTTRSDGKSWPRRNGTWMMASGYNQALLAPAKKKNMQLIAGRVDVPEDRVEQFIRESPWEYERLQVHLNVNIPAAIMSPHGAFIVDEVGITKQGKHSVGVQRQYNGAQGKVGNSQVAVDLIYAVPGERRNADQKTWPLGMDIYLPEHWTEDRERRKEVGIPDSVVFMTKPQIALSLIDRALDQGLMPAFVTADCGYGDSSEFRKHLRDRHVPYVLAISPGDIRVVNASVNVMTGNGTRQRTRGTFPEGTAVESATDIAGRTDCWKTVTWSDGTKGKMKGEFSPEMVRIIDNTAKRYVTDELCWLLLERIEGKSGVVELKAYLCWGMDSASLKHLVKSAHVRWTIEQFHRDAKQLLGLDSFEGRSWKGWHHHISMVLLAFAFLSLLRAEAQNSGGRLPSLRQVARAVVLEVATRELMMERIRLKKYRRDSTRAKYEAEFMLRRFSDW